MRRFSSAVKDECLLVMHATQVIYKIFPLIVDVLVSFGMLWLVNNLPSFVVVATKQ